MATAQKIVSNALTDLRMQSELIPADPQLEADAFDRFVSMLYQWADVGISIGLDLPAAITDELNNARGDELALAHSLALEMAPRAPVEPPTRLMRQYKVARRRLKAKWGSNPVQQYPSSLPLGQGNRLGPHAQRFFPEPDTLGNNSDSIGS